MSMTADGTRRTVLVVEDEQLVRRLLERVLTRPGTQVLLAADGAEAIDIYHRHQGEISVVLLDLGLPKVSGWDVFSNMKQHNPDVRVVVASGYMEPDIKKRFQSAGVKQFIDKPYLLDHLIEVLHRESEVGN